jgi:photosystem II stability/assembly factor-like uncharacterized protein
MNYQYLTIICMLILFTNLILPQNNWNLQSSGVTATLNCIRVVDNNTVWAAGDSGVVLRTIDGGITWTSVGGGIIGDNIIWNIDAIDENIAFVTITPSSITYLYRTTNGGLDWDLVYSQNGGFINDIHMIDQLNGIAYGDPVGGKWTVIKTTDGGATWDRISTEPTPIGSEFGIYYNSLCVTDSLHIWFLGDHRVYRSIDGGINWSYSTTTNYFLSIWFNTNAVGMASTNVFNTSESSIDSGKTWNSTSSPGPGTPYAMAGAGTRDFLYASDGYIYHTTDNGSSWTEEMVTFNQFFAIDFVTIGQTAIGYAGGTNGSLARFEGTITSINPITNTLTEYSLGQNYPNPFNPTSTIKFSIPFTQNVTIKVFDALGNIVLNLYDEETLSGTYELKIDGSNLSSGIYFYQLQAGNFIETKKFVLIK